MKIWLFLRKAKWKETFAILPHRCRISKRIIWLKKAYKGVAIYEYDYRPDLTETHWHETGEHIKWLLIKDTDESLATVTLMAHDLINVQPMTGSAGSIFEMKKRYDKK
jgi:hypothetical protein